MPHVEEFNPDVESRLDEAAHRRWQHALMQTAWGRAHMRPYALTEDGVRLASATRYLLPGTLDGQAVRVCALGDLSSMDQSDRFTRTLVEDAVADAAARCGADVALLFCDAAEPWCEQLGFHDITPVTTALRFGPTRRPGAPMLSIRAGEERDLPAIVAMGQIAAAPFRFHLERDVDFVQFGIVARRLLAGLARRGAQELQFFVTEEGMRAAAYIVLGVTEGTWTILQCGDRDPSGARVGAILQALIARDPAALAPTIRGWLPPGFVPPQATPAPVEATGRTVMASLLREQRGKPPLRAEHSLLWANDCF